jgi:GAF domain-containing protein
VVTGQEMRAGLSVPVQLEGGPIGTLDLYSAKPRDWDQAEISAAPPPATGPSGGPWLTW